MFATAVSLTLSTCGTREVVPVEEFAPYISAYTGGIISTSSSVQIELVEAQDGVTPNMEVKDNLFSFTPSLKGKAYWLNSHTIEFVPEEKALKNGESYTAQFKLGKILKNIDKRLSTFEFQFHVEEADYTIVMFPLDIATSKTVSVAGEIHFRSPTTLEKVQKSLRFALSNNQSLAPVIEAIDEKKYSFRVNNIAASANLQLTISVDGKKYQTLQIPAMDAFNVLSAEVVYKPEYGIQIVFSDPLSTNQNVKGLITIPEIKNFTTRTQNNIVTIFFDPKNIRKATVTVNKNIKNSSGGTLARAYETELTIEQPKPQIELINGGNILPSSSNLKLPFRAVSLRAVDLNIIQIYENNILSFLQANALDGSDELRRVGRLMFKKTLWLTNATNTFDTWQNYAIDLSNIFKQQPGAIYRIELSFTQAYSTYPCDDNRVLGEPAEKPVGNSLQRIVSEEITEKEQSFWDTPTSYYYSSGDYDWDEYDSDEADNPCHPTYYMGNRKKVVCNVMSSNLGVIAKANSENKLWVSVADILDTKPVGNAAITVYNYQLQTIGSGTTDAEGFAVVPTKGKPFVLVAESNGQKTYLRLVDGSNNSLSRFDTGGKTIDKGLKGYIYGERGVWRPGDTLHITFVLFDPDKRIPANHPVSFELYNPLGQFNTKQTATTGVNGFYTFAVPTKASDPTGLWNAYIRVGGTSFHQSFHIETIKPNRLKVNLDLGITKIEAYKEAPSVTLSSAWLTGATAHSLKAKVEMTLRRTETQFKGYEKYLFNAPANDFETSETEIFSGTLNEAGVVRFNLKAPKAENAPGMLNATLVTRVFEPGGDASIATQTIPFSPYRSYVGLNLNQPAGKYLETDVANTFDVVTLNADGKAVDRSNLEYKIYKVSWSWWWENSSESVSSYVNNSSYKPVAEGTLRTTGGKTSFKYTLKYPAWGRYLVYVKDKESGHATGGFAYIDWPEYRGRSDKKNPEGIKMLTFSTDKPAYEIGEKATVIIPASGGGTALVALENGSNVISRNWVSLQESGDTKYSFTVTKEMTPNFYIHISLLQPHAQTVNDLPIRMYGLVPITVTNKESFLNPQIKMNDELRPEQSFTVEVSEKDGKPMTYTLAIVDDGLLDLTNFKTPNPWSEFYAREALGIRTWDMYDNVIGAFGGSLGGLFSVGGDEALKSANTQANRFKPVVKFIGPFALGSGKTASHTLSLPMYVGSVRTMVVAGQDGAYGKAEKTTPVRSPLMVLSSLPRVLSTDEEISLPVNVFAMEAGVKDVTVKIETANDLLTLTESAQKKVHFSQAGDQLIYFNLKTKSVTGMEKVTISASGNGLSTTETIEIDVRNPNPPVIISDTKLLNVDETGEFAYQLASNNKDNWVRLETSRIPSVDISRRFDFLYNYSNYCSEQVTSRAFPLLYLSQFKDLNSDEEKNIQTNVSQAIQTLYSRQLSNGGFVYWPGNAIANDWVSIYAGHFLVKAKEKGYEVNEGVLKRWKSEQVKQVQAGASDATQAYRLYTLALAGATELGAMNRMKESKDLNTQSRWLLAAAYAVDGKVSVAEDLVFNRPTSIAPYYSRNTYGSSMRDEAIILETLVLINHLEDAFKHAQRVSKSLTDESYFSTQSTAFALVAMGQLAEKTSGQIKYAWTLNGKKQDNVKSSKAVIQTDLKKNPLEGKITLTNNEKGLLYVALVSKTKPAVDTLSAISNNLKLEINYLNDNGNSVNISELKQGSDFVASVKVTNTSPTENYTDIALTHILPSGWEIFNNPESNNYTYRDIRDDRVLTYFDLNRGTSATFKIRLQASYIGTFVLPAVQCEAMYDTSAQARTTAGRVKVVK